ncbi:hypothetical protein D3C78_1010720 [compost metagenome]
MLLQLRQGLQCRRQAQLDTPGQPGLLPVTARRGIVVAGEVAADQRAVLRQGRRHAQGAVTGKGPHLEYASGACQFDQQGEELPLLRRYLPARHGQRLGFITQTAQQRRFAQRYIEQVVVEVIVEIERTSGHDHLCETGR